MQYQKAGKSRTVPGDELEALRRQFAQAEQTNKILQAQLSHMRTTNDRYRQSLEAYKSDAARRYQRIGEVVVYYLSRMCSLLVLPCMCLNGVGSESIDLTREPDVDSVRTLFSFIQVMRTHVLDLYEHSTTRLDAQLPRDSGAPVEDLRRRAAGINSNLDSIPFVSDDSWRVCLPAC